MTIFEDGEGMRAEDVNVAGSSVTTLAPDPTRSVAEETKARHTRTSGAWVSMALGLTALVVVLVFTVQNVRSVEVSFLSLHWTPPLAVLLMVASALGGLVVFAFGAARIGQLRIQARRARRRSTAATRD